MELSKKSVEKIRLSGKHLVRITYGYKSFKSENKLLMDRIVPKLTKKIKKLSQIIFRKNIVRLTPNQDR